LLAQDVDVESLLIAKQCQVLAARNGFLYGGLADGGVLIWDREDPTTYQRWTTDDGLTANRVTDLFFIGDHLWIATSGGGLTLVVLDDGDPEFWPFAADLGGMALSAVTGEMHGDQEDIYFGIEDGGVGIFTDQVFGGVFTTGDPDSLVDNRVTDLTLFQGDLWVATQDGVSQRSGTVFRDRIDGLADTHIQVIHAVGDTLLLAGTATDGVYRWDDAGEEWAKIGGLAGSILSLAVDDAGIWALRVQTAFENQIRRWNGSSWQTLALPHPRGRVLLSDGDIWVAGEFRTETMSRRSGRAFLARREGESWQDWITDEQLMYTVDGLAFGPDGALWLGSRTGDAVARRDQDGWFNIHELATVENDSLGLFAGNDGLHGPNILSLTVRENGEVWFGQFTKGVIRYTPAGAGGQPAEDFDHLTAENCALSSDRVGGIVQHPAGPLLFLTDGDGADVLLQPDSWSDPGVWLQVPTEVPGLGGGLVRDAAVARPDVIWFAVQDVGIVRWDINGLSLGPEDGLTWLDTGDDFWHAPITSIPGAIYEVTGTSCLAIAADGSIWAGGGSGVVQFSFDVAFGQPTLLQNFWEKGDTFAVGLLTNTVNDLVLDGNGHLWVAMDAGLNRIRTVDGTVTIDAYTDLVSFFDYSFGLLYATTIITGLPGGANMELAADSRNPRLLVGADNGAALLTILAEAEPPGTGDSRSWFVYPNPFDPPEDEGDRQHQLKVGGLGADSTGGVEFLAAGDRVEIFNLEGQLVARATEGVAIDEVWNGRNREGRKASTGLYVVVIRIGGEARAVPLAVVDSPDH